MSSPSGLDVGWSGCMREPGGLVAATKIELSDRISHDLWHGACRGGCSRPSARSAIAASAGDREPRAPELDRFGRELPEEAYDRQHRDIELD